MCDQCTVGLPKKTIDEFSTCELVDELKCRMDSVEHSRISENVKAVVDIDGPADVLVVRA
ncbi:hypothetical protein [Gordonibacter massiliensis (ex Traore et al. 2017)]|uniref:hypothetical protein n=1 Tax=Gordonibacter massiliensis (ex Traore et al. 2017) TaxID=1841863 RepID=UPI001C8BCB3C|nr:hypothetical protein [Gordonibacter massiliensis (ex Traore et al. 2017)]MBX9035075.1 hypothetical protein [Gordonibacter massiliensis (ex Traore et al. 2017)]